MGKGNLSTDALNKIFATRQMRTVILDNAVRVFFATKVSSSFLVLYLSRNINILFTLSFVAFSFTREKIKEMC